MVSLLKVPLDLTICKVTCQAICLDDFPEDARHKLERVLILNVESEAFAVLVRGTQVPHRPVWP